MRLSEAQLQQFHDDGFVVVPNFFTREQIEPVIAWIDELVDDLAQRLHADGRIRDLHAGEGFYTRLTKLEQEFPGAAVLIHIRGLLGQPLADLWGSKPLLDIIEQILGPEIVGHPVWSLRSKTPLNPLATVPWHQDTAYLAPGAERTLQPTAWIPFVDAEREKTKNIWQTGDDLQDARGIDRMIARADCEGVHGDVMARRSPTRRDRESR